MLFVVLFVINELCLVNASALPILCWDARIR